MFQILLMHGELNLFMRNLWLQRASCQHRALLEIIGIMVWMWNGPQEVWTTGLQLTVLFGEAVEPLGQWRCWQKWVIMVRWEALWGHSVSWGVERGYAAATYFCWCGKNNWRCHAFYNTMDWCGPKHKPKQPSPLSHCFYQLLGRNNMKLSTTVGSAKTVVSHYNFKLWEMHFCEEL